MTNVVISAEVKALNATEADEKLGNLFDRCFRLENLIQNSDLPSNDDNYQDAVNCSIIFLEKCTKLVNELGLFSSNEEIDEVSSSDIKYLLLPALLGDLKLKILNKEPCKRLNNLQVAEIYFKDFLTRCKNYQVSDIDLAETEEEDKQSLNTLTSVREKKIQQYKKLKELKNREDELKIAVNRKDVDDNHIREYYHVLLKKWILTSLEELENIKKEKPLLQMMAERQELPKPVKIKPTQPLKPIVITKNEIQKKVFGLGYPSLPVMSIDDFYRQRFQKAHQPTSHSDSLQDRAFSGKVNSREEEEKEELLEKDDPVALQKARCWDDWKDENPRGGGNRWNKG